jgi:hypothetical protein
MKFTESGAKLPYMCIPFILLVMCVPKNFVCDLYVIFILSDLASADESVCIPWQLQYLQQSNVIQLRENTDPEGSYQSSHFILQTIMQYGEQVSLPLCGCKTILT